jgi:cellulose synthase/poly-beta-1,6-N-acetylglucosamine synthase-like glycosyltransferase
MTIDIKKNLDYHRVSTDWELPVAIEKTTGNDLVDWKKKLCQIGDAKILFCITVYNEPGTALLCSLAGLKQNLDYLVRSGKKAVAEQVVLCLIFDGRDKMSASSSDLLEALEISQSSQGEPNLGDHVFSSQLQLERVQQLINVESSLNPSDDSWLAVYQTAQLENELSDNYERLESIRALVCIKEKNRGKLNSHWWFFNVFCTCLQPAYCVQMDVGGVIQARNIHDLWEFLERNLDVGAAAGSILAQKPKNILNLVGVWQFGNFCLDKLLFSPAEMLSGYRSVLPGQFSIMRWQALAPHPFEDLQHKQKPSPLDYYFRGLNRLSIFESIMFLAEDRVIGWNMVTDPQQNWRLSHLDSVVTVTDSCGSLQELLRQRRRWINGAFASRLWMLFTLPQYLADSRASFLNKVRLLRSTPLYLLRTFTDFFHPALSVIFLTSLFDYTESIFQDYSYSLWQIHAAFIISLLLLIFQVITCLINVRVYFIWFINVIYQSLFLLLSLAIYLWAGHYLSILLIAFLMVIISTVAQRHSTWLAKGVWQYIPLYILISFSTRFLLYSYSFCNINDCSWGTKGLTAQNQNILNKLLWASPWLTSNAILIILALKFNHLLVGLLVLIPIL